MKWLDGKKILIDLVLDAFLRELLKLYHYDIHEHGTVVFWSLSFYIYQRTFFADDNENMQMMSMLLLIHEDNN